MNRPISRFSSIRKADSSTNELFDSVLNQSSQAGALESLQFTLPIRWILHDTSFKDLFFHLKWHCMLGILLTSCFMPFDHLRLITYNLLSYLLRLSICQIWQTKHSLNLESGMYVWRNSVSNSRVFPKFASQICQIWQICWINNKKLD